jgi:zinc transport system ATP-binding protein
VANEVAQGPGAALADPPALHVHRVHVTFGGVVALQDVSFDLDRGQTLAIVGPNGAGKSTLVRVVLGLVRPQQGHAAILGRHAGVDPRRIGYVPQLKTFDRSFPATALELVVSGSRLRWPGVVRAREREAAAQALASVGAGHLLGRPLAGLSGGELQRVYLARALVREPDVVLLDEPATGVDFLGEHDLYDLLEGYQRQTNAAITMITHDLTAARYHSDRVLVLNRRAHGYGPPGEVLTDECLREAYGHLGHEHPRVIS